MIRRYIDAPPEAVTILDPSLKGKLLRAILTIEYERLEEIPHPLRNEISEEEFRAIRSDDQTSKAKDED